MLRPLLLLLALFVLCACCLVLLRQDAVSRRRRDQITRLNALPGDAAPEPASVRRKAPSADGATPWYCRLVGFRPEAPRLWPPARSFAAGALAGIAVLVLARSAAPLAVAVVAGLATALLVPRLLFDWQQRSYADRLTRQLPDTVQIVISAVRAGMPVADAFATVAAEMPAPTAEQFRLVVDELAVGRSADEAVLDIFHRTRVQEFAIFAVTLSVQRKSGGRLSDTLQILADTIRGRIALAGRARALSAEAKFSARVLTALPFLAGTVLTLERPGYFSPLLASREGRMLLLAGAGLMAAGIGTMRRMIRTATSV